MSDTFLKKNYKINISSNKTKFMVMWSMNNHRPKTAPDGDPIEQVLVYGVCYINNTNECRLQKQMLGNTIES